MKAKQGIQFFIAFCILLLGSWAGYDYYRSQNQKEKEEKQSVLFPDLELKELKAFKVFSKESKVKSFFITKKGEEWFVIEPVKDLASFAEVSRWLDTISKQKVQKINTETSINWEDYGLGSLSAKVELQKDSGEKLTFLVSHKNSFDGRSFLKKDNQLFITDNISFEVNDKNFEDFRSKKILPLNPHVTQVEIQGGKESLTLIREQAQWSLKNKSSDVPDLDQEVLEEFWTNLSQLKAKAIIAPIKESKKYGLHKAQRIFNVFYGEELYKLRVSPFKGEKAFVSVRGRDFIFEISKSQAEEIFISKKELYKKPEKKESEETAPENKEIENKETTKKEPKETTPTKKEP